MSAWPFRIAAIAVTLAGVLAATPTLLLDRAVTDTRQCFEHIEQRKSAPLPACDAAADRLQRLTRMPTTSRAATRLAEELRVRWALARYLDAAIGQPNAAQRREHFKPLDGLPKQLQGGSGQLRFDELGPPLAGPEPGVWAQRVGDAAALAQGELRYSHHYVAGAIYRSLLVVGEDKRARRLASRYAGSPDDELRLATAALLCLDGQTQRGIDEVAKIEQRRAEKRSANFWRHFGDMRLVIEACGAQGGAKVPALPSYGYAGVFDQRARVLALRLRMGARRCEGGRVSRQCEAVRFAVDDAVEQLSQGNAQPHRLALLASIATAIDEPELLRRLARRVEGEPLLDEGEVALADWLPDDRLPRDQQVRPYVPAASYERAAAHVLMLVESGGKGSGGKAESGGKTESSGGAGPDGEAASGGKAKPSGEAADRELRDLARRWLIHAAVGHARAGRAAQASQAAEVAMQGRSSSEQHQFRATLAMLRGDRPQARQALAAAPAGSPLRRASYLLQRAELQLPDHDAARVDLASAEPLLAQIERPLRDRLMQRLWWLRAAAGGDAPEAAAVLRRPSGPLVGHVPLGPDTSLGLERALLAQWVGWTQQPAPRITARYRSWRAREAPRHSISAFFWLAGQLADAPEQTEVWLDALGSHALRALPLRRYAFARARAARWRGDAQAHALWWRRYQKLEGWAHHDKLAELYRALSI